MTKYAYECLVNILVEHDCRDFCDWDLGARSWKNLAEDIGDFLETHYPGFDRQKYFHEIAYEPDPDYD